MPSANCGNPLELPAEVAHSYHNTLLVLRKSQIPHLIGGAYALAHYTGVVRHTKDFDLFIRPADRDRAMAALTAAGYATNVEFPYWLAKAFVGDHMIDLLYRAPNGVVEVTDEWFQRGFDCEVLGTPGRVCAPEEILITKLFVLNNDRNDLADVMHLFYSCAEQMDWDHLLRLLGPYWRVLLGHIVFFGFVYPSERQRIPSDLVDRLLRQMQGELGTPAPEARVCNGPLFSHSQYKIDLESRGFADGRLLPHGRMTPRERIDSTISTDDPNRPAILSQAEADQAATGRPNVQH